MDIILRTTGLDEGTAVAVLNLLAAHNATQLRKRPMARLYDSGVVYRREKKELWSDAASTLAAGHEDCDALAAWRAGELLAYGWKALERGEPGWAEAGRLKPASIPAEVMLTTRTRPGEGGLYHCIVRYQVGGRWYRDDPSARLGMVAGLIDNQVLARWRRAGVRARAPLET